eukprot:COSAG06_NODE_18422_length_888_cov_7.642586_2_plen_65_part_00
MDPSTEFFQPTESYLQFRLKLNLGSAGNAMRLQLNPDIAAHSLLRDSTIPSPDRLGTLTASADV